ncbi:MAG TPA: HNH endonuclease [Pseudoxanthomonas sp.]|jgi:hypothetical protein|nr:HNH endonuclease [Pseudoxanthomonas sp.]
MQYWWVNQNQTYAHEVGGGYLWSPKTKVTGAYNRFYDSMTEVSPGDFVFSFSDTYIKAIGIVVGPTESATKPPEFGSSGAVWAKEGWRVPVEFTELAKPLRPKDFIESLRTALPKKYSPLQTSGNGNQGVYLAPVPLELAEKLIALLDGQVEAVAASADSSFEGDDSNAISSVLGDPGLKATQREQLIQARIGQGLFRLRVGKIETHCRVTGISDTRFLIASHIKPWSKSTNAEKLDGSNGLLLAPHIDRLFDKGYLTFVDDGKIKVSEQLPFEVHEAWGLKSAVASKPLSERQIEYMTFHRSKVFKG